MFGIGGTELLIILLFAFLIVGPDRLPEIAKTLGKAVAKFRETQDEMNEAIKKETDAIKEEAAKAQRKAEAEERRARVAEQRAAEEAASANVVESTDDPKPARQVKVTRVDNATSVAPASNDGSAAQQPAKPMSFSERKAAYERQRAEREKAAAAAAAESAKSAESEREGE